MACRAPWKAFTGPFRGHDAYRPANTSVTAYRFCTWRTTLSPDQPRFLETTIARIYFAFFDSVFTLHRLNAGLAIFFGWGLLNAGFYFGRVGGKDRGDHQTLGNQEPSAGYGYPRDWRYDGHFISVNDGWAGSIAESGYRKLREPRSGRNFR